MIVKNDRIFAQGVTGVRRAGSTTPLTLNDRINFGSCTKLLTATIAARLIDRGLIQWNSKVRDIFPEKVSTYNAAFLDVTLNDILAHRAGIEENVYYNNNHWATFSVATGTTSQLRALVCDEVLSDTPEVTKGTFLYANQGFSVAAAMLERVSGKSWEDLMQQEVFAPLHMTTAGLGVSYDDALPPKGPVGHTLSGTTWVPNSAFTGSLLQHYQASNGPGGTVICTLADYAKLLTVYCDGGKNSTYLTTATRTQLLTTWLNGVKGDGSGNDYYAHGVFVMPASMQPWVGSTGQALNHGGDIFGEDTLFWVGTARNFIILLYTNAAIEGSADSNALNEIVTALINKYPSSSTVTGPYIDGPAMAAAAKSGSTFTLTGYTLPTGVYQLQSSTDLSTWTNSGATVTATDFTTAFTATISGTQHPYYRIKTVP